MSEKRQRRPISTEGKAIKAMLIELDMTQRQFCETCGIPYNRMSDIIHTDITSGQMIPWRLKIYENLQRLLKEAAG